MLGKATDYIAEEPPTHGQRSASHAQAVGQQNLVEIDLGVYDGQSSTPSVKPSCYLRMRGLITRLHARCQKLHSQMPYIRAMPLPAILIIALLIVVQLVVWAIVGIVLASHYQRLLSTAALAYSLGLRHALDADHISAIDLMTRRLIATGQRSVTVGTFFSLGHSTIVVITSIVVAATAAGVQKRFGSFSKIGGIIGTSVSASFLILLGMMNMYILWKLMVQMRKVIGLQPEQEAEQAWNVEGGGPLFKVLKKMFKLIDRPWKMYPLGVMFGLGFDTSSEVALLGISSIQGAKGTSIWLILIFPVLFTTGMCLIDTIDGALMSSLYLAPMGLGGKKHDQDQQQRIEDVSAASPQAEENSAGNDVASADVMIQNPQVRSPITFLYYSIVLTALTVLVAMVIGIIQLLTLVLNVAISDEALDRSTFWQGVQTAGDYYDVIGGAICGSFVIVGIVSVLCYKPFRRWVDEKRTTARLGLVERGEPELLQDTVGEVSASTSSARNQPSYGAVSDAVGWDTGVDQLSKNRDLVEAHRIDS